MLNMLPVCGRISHSQQLGTIMIMKLASPYYQNGMTSLKNANYKSTYLIYWMLFRSANFLATAKPKFNWQSVIKSTLKQHRIFFFMILEKSQICHYDTSSFLKYVSKINPLFLRYVITVKNIYRFLRLQKTPTPPKVATVLL